MYFPPSKNTIKMGYAAHHPCPTGLQQSQVASIRPITLTSLQYTHFVDPRRNLVVSYLAEEPNIYSLIYNEPAHL